MASLVSSAFVTGTGPSFSFAAPPRSAVATARTTTTRSSSTVTARASLGKAAGTAAAAAVVAATSALMLSLSVGSGAGGAAMAAAREVLLGTDDGALAFVPSELTVKAGETITFRNNAAFPHNVVFDEDEVPGGVDAAGISQGEEELLNAPGETYSVTLTVPVTYGFYCAPHQGAGMVGKVTVVE